MATPLMKRFKPIPGTVRFILLIRLDPLEEEENYDGEYRKGAEIAHCDL